jgi:hypothetical protein
MKKIIFFALAMAMFASCAPTVQVVEAPATTPKYTRLMSTSTDLAYKNMKPVSVTELIADLDVLTPEKITYFYIPSKSVLNGGHQNVIETAIREALIENNNADVLVGLETQIKYASSGEIESITITGYPARYVNFRSVNEEYILELAKIYMDLHLQLNYYPGPNPVPNIIPDIRPVPEKEAPEVPAASATSPLESVKALPFIGKLK